MHSRPLTELKEEIVLAKQNKNVAVLQRIATELTEWQTEETTAIAMIARGHAEWLSANFTLAKDSYLAALGIFEQLEDQSGIASCIMGLGLTHLEVGELNLAVERFLEALSIYEELSDAPELASVLVKLGLAYDRMGDTPRGLDHLQRAVTIYQKLGDTRYEATTLISIGESQENTGDLKGALDSFNKALSVCESQNNRIGMAAPYAGIGRVYLNLGDFPAALENMHRSLSILTELGDPVQQSSILGNIGVVYFFSGDYPTALEYWSNALAENEKAGSLVGIANMLCNCGNIYGETGDQARALEYYSRALEIHLQIGDRRHAAIDVGNIANTHSILGDYDEALRYAKRSLSIYEEIGDMGGYARATAHVASVYIDMGNIDAADALHVKMDEMVLSEPRAKYSHQHGRARILELKGDLDGAVEAMKTALKIASDAGFRQQIAGIHKELRDLAMKRNDFPGYVEHNNEYTRITEEINGKDTATKLAMQAKQREIDAREKEHEKYMSVLHSTLPKHIAERVARGEVVNDQFDNASVLFLDVVGFTTHSSELGATAVVELLQNIFTTFDAICANNDVTKIKTIGDSYMAVAFDETNVVGARPRLAREQTGAAREQMGIANSEQRIANSEQRIANVARAMMASEFVWPHTGERVMFRIGIHSGPVVAGVLGTERLQYDVWGDTVNVASRMESTSEPGKIHVSEALAAALNEHKNSPPDPLSHASLERGSHTVVPRGIVDVKGKGTMQTYWLE